MDALGSIGAQVEDYDLVLTVTLNGLKDDEAWKSFFTFMYVYENILDFEQLKVLMILKEKNMGRPSI